VNSLGTSPATRRDDQLDYIASHLLPRAALLVRLLIRQVREREISRMEGEVLGTLTEGPRRITELAELVGVAQPTMTVLIKRLEHSGWVARKGLPEDGRVVMVNITDAGRTAFEAFRARFLAVLRNDLECLSDQQLAALLTATDTLGSFVDELQRGVGR
jgi:DNA-binding MarR family transcriptional regulator